MTPLTTALLRWPSARRAMPVLLIIGASLAYASDLPAQSAGITASVETAPLPHAGDAAHDAAVWIDSSDPARSVAIGTDKLGGLAVYDLQGRQLHYYAGTSPVSVDLRYDFSLSGQPVTLVTTNDRATKTLRIYTVDPATRGLVEVSARAISLQHQSLALCMYRSSRDAGYYAVESDSSGGLYQWRLFDAGNGKVDAARVRTVAVGSTVGGCVADDELGRLYVGERAGGIWRYGAEPDAADARSLVDAVDPLDLAADVEGLALYRAAGGKGYLIASSEGSSKFHVYDRSGDNAFVRTFGIGAGLVDGVTRASGIEVTNRPLGPGFPDGMFVAQDDQNGSANQNFKLVRWGAIAGTAPPLQMDTTFDPRLSVPVNDEAPAITGTPDERQRLLATAGTWTGGAPFSYAYQWQRCDSAGADCADIEKATATTYTLTAADVGKRIRVQVTATNAAGSGVAESAPTAAVRSTCPRFAPGADVGTIDFAGGKELSGLAASRRNPGVLWSHNDSGDTERMFAIDTQGNLLATYKISDGPQSDWEDVAVGPGPVAGTSYLYIGAIGGNGGRHYIAVYRVPEPVVTQPAGAPPTIDFTGAVKLKMQYPGVEQHNSEALMVDRRTKDIYVVTKSTDVARVFRYPQTADPAVSYKLQLMRTLNIPAVTAGDISPDASEIVLKGYDQSFLWPRPAGVTVAWALQAAPCEIPHGRGEAIGFSASGDSYFTVREGSLVPLMRFARLPG